MNGPRLGCTIQEHRMPIDPFLTPLPLPATPHLLEVSHVAHRLSSSDEYVRRLIRAGKLKAIRLGTRWRVDPLVLQAFIDAQQWAGESHGSPLREARGPDGAAA